MEPGAAPLSLPPGWSAGTPREHDVPALHHLVLRQQRSVRGTGSTTVDAVASDVCGAGARTRHHLLVRDDGQRVQGWASVHGRAAARAVVSVVVDPDLAPAVADPLAAELFRWAEQVSLQLGAERGVDSTQLDSGAYADDRRQQRWLAAAGLRHVRTWWQMRRPVDPGEAEPGALPEPDDGVVIRTVRADPASGLPVQADVATVHDVLETAFTDHFNYHQESFEEFCARLRADPGHRWDHWWIAELVSAGGRPEPAGALVGAVSPGLGDAPDASYVEYLGVLRTARGRGVATSLLHAAIADAARRGRPEIGIEVDQDSATGAASLYLSRGFVTAYVTQSWHRDLPVPR